MKEAECNRGALAGAVGLMSSLGSIKVSKHSNAGSKGGVRGSRDCASSSVVWNDDAVEGGRGNVDGARWGGVEARGVVAITQWGSSEVVV